MTTLRSTDAIASTPIGGQALLYGAAAKAVRAGGAREMQAARLRASLADTSAWAALMEWAVFEASERDWYVIVLDDETVSCPTCRSRPRLPSTGRINDEQE